MKSKHNRTLSDVSITVLVLGLGALASLLLINKFPRFYQWLWTDTGVIYQLAAGGILTLIIFALMRLINPEEHPGILIRRHCDKSRKLGVYGFIYFLGEPMDNAVRWLIYQLFCSLVKYAPWIGNPLVRITRPLVVILRRDAEKDRQHIEQRIAEWEARQKR